MMNLFFLFCTILVVVTSHAHLKNKADIKGKNDAIAACPFFGQEFTHQTKNEFNETQKIDCSEETTHAKAERLGTDPDPGQKTIGGCTCKSVCGATAEDGFNCDWCKTDNKCGSYSYAYGGWWDWCSYPANDESQDFTAKSSALWAKVTADITSSFYPNILTLLSMSVQTSFDDMWDVMPAGRSKVIHSVGATCLINFDINVVGYTGIFKKGTSLGFVRMGSATEVGQGGMAPGNGYKFMRTGNVSANWVSLFDLNGQKSWNFFKNNQSNHIAPPTGVTAVLGKKFEQSSGCVSTVGLSDAARVDQDGTYYERPVFPWSLKMVPTPAAKALMDDNKETDTDGLMDSLTKIEYHFHLFDVYAQSSPTAEEELLGSMTTATPCYRSKFGDEKLLFRHQRMEEDFQYKPEWLTEMNAMEVCGTNDVGTTPPAKCIDKPVPPSTNILKKKILQN